MSFPPATSAEAVIDQPARAQFEAFLDEHRNEPGLDEIVRGNRRGPIPLRRVYLHVLRELAPRRFPSSSLPVGVAILLFTGLPASECRRLAGRRYRSA